jgi:hypothetical protein
VKFNFIQGDFSSGELSPRAQGHADSEAYKAGLRLASNCVPTRTGSIASRGGLEFLLDGIDGNTLAASNLPVQHIPIHDGPFGDFVLEISPTGIRVVDKTGILQPWNFPPSSEFLQFTQQDGSFAYADPSTGTVYLRSEVAVGGVRSYYLSKATREEWGVGPGMGGPQNAIIAGGTAFAPGGFSEGPPGTNHTWILSGKIAGDSVILRVQQDTPANFQEIVINPAADGTFSTVFRPNIGGVDENFYLQLKSYDPFAPPASGATSTVLLGLKLIKHNAKEVQDTTAVIVPPSFSGVRVVPSQERVRAAGFWAFGDYWIAFAGGPGNSYATFAMRWTFNAGWTFGTLPCTANSLNQIRGANAVAVYQDRLWYGINLTFPKGQRVIRASAIGYGAAWGYAAQAGSTGAHLNATAKPYLFQFIVETENSTPLAGTAQVAYSFPCLAPNSELIVKVGVARPDQVRRPAPDYLAAGHTFDYQTQRPTGYQLLKHMSGFLNSILPDYVPANGVSTLDQDTNPGGLIYFNPAGGAGIAVNSFLSITRVALATDPLDLNLASPAGKIAWLNVLRGLALGTTRSEKRFIGDGGSLDIDPATGQAFDLRDESNLGADPALPALTINDRILFAQTGRKVLRMAGISITSDGGLVSEDIGVAGEHLTKARIRSLCYLKSPVPRAVFAFDDGTGAVMTLVGKGVAFSRFTIPACFGGIYSVAALDSDDDSELWVGTENGVTLRARTFESDITVKQVVVPNAVPAAPTHTTYDNDNPLPPIMDAWIRRPLVNQGGAQYATGLPASSVGQNAYALVNGQVRGPYVVGVGGKVTFEVAPALDKTWVDANGKRRATEIYVGLKFTEHRWTTLPLEGGNPVGSSQNLTSRKPQLHLRLVDSYLPLVNGKRLAERGGSDLTDVLAGRVTGDRRATEEGFQRGSVVDVVMDLPLRMEISAVHGGVVMNNV